MWCYHSTFFGTFNFQRQSYYFRSGTSIFFNMTMEQQWLKTHSVGIASYVYNCYQYSSLQRLQRPLGTLQCCFLIIYKPKSVTNCHTNYWIQLCFLYATNTDYTVDLCQAMDASYEARRQCRMCCVDVVTDWLRIISYLNKIQTFISTISQPSVSTHATVNLG